MKYPIRLFFILFLATILLCAFISCQENNEPNSELTPWYGRKTMLEQFKWYSNATNYFDSNYQEKFYKLYNNFIENNQQDSALYYLLVYSEMIDQNYIDDSTWLKTAKLHLEKYETANETNGELLKLYYYISSEYLTIGNNELCKKWALLALNKPNLTPRFKAKCHRTLSEIYHTFSEPEKAIPHAIEYLAYFQQKNDTLNIGVAYSGLSGIYRELYAYETAENYLKKAIEYSILKKDTYTLIFHYGSLAILQNQQNKDDTTFLKSVKELHLLAKSYSELTPFLQSLDVDAQINKFYILNQLDSVPKYLADFKKLALVLNDSVTSKNYYTQKVRYEFSKTGTISNLSELENVAKIAMLNKDNPIATACYTYLYKYAYAKGQFKKAIDYKNIIVGLERDLYAKNNQGQLYDKDIKYQTSLKDKELKLKEEELTIKQRNIGLLVASIIIMALVIIVILFYQNHKEQKFKRENELLFTQKLMENTEEERMRIAKDLHDSIGHELLNVKSAISNKLQFTEDKIDHILAEVREISRNLFPVMFEEVGLKISVEQLIEQIIKSEGFFVIGEINYIPGTLDTKAELNIYRIIQEALSNVRKYAQAQSAKVGISQTKDSIDVHIIDNGKGFDVMEVLKSGKAFGLMSINQRCLALKSAVSIESGNSGTVVSFQIKL